MAVTSYPSGVFTMPTRAKCDCKRQKLARFAFNCYSAASVRQVGSAGTAVTAARKVVRVMAPGSFRDAAILPGPDGDSPRPARQLSTAPQSSAASTATLRDHPARPPSATYFNGTSMTGSPEKPCDSLNRAETIRDAATVRS